MLDDSKETKDIPFKYIEKQKEYFYSGATRSYEFRIEQLRKLKVAVKKREERILEALYKDLGKNSYEGYITEIGMIYEEIEFTLKRLKKWMKPQKVRTPIFQPFSKSMVYSEPRGVALIIAPWNYPFQLLMAPLIGAIAAGNTCLIKTSKNSPYTSKIIQEIIIDSFEDRYIHYIDGGNDEVMKVLEEKIDFVFFTGSPKVGSQIMQKASKNLIPIVLELGGKSPAIIDKNADVKMAAYRLIWAKLLNSGQTCIAPDHVYIHQSIKDVFIKKATEVIEEFYGSDIAKSKDYGRIINTKQFDRLVSYLDKDKIVYGGSFDRNNLFIEPTIMDNISYEDKIMEDEIFGPILPLLIYEDINSIINEIKRKPKPLALYVYTSDNQVEEKIIREIQFGGGCINDSISHVSNPHLPFGGVGNSGMGSYHGKASFDTFSHKKSILKKSNFFNMKLPFPPYEGKIKIVKKLLK